MAEPIEVKVGQVWQDRDKRMDSRRVRVTEIEHRDRWMSHFAGIGGTEKVAVAVLLDVHGVGRPTRVAVERLERQRGWLLCAGGIVLEGPIADEYTRQTERALTAAGADQAASKESAGVSEQAKCSVCLGRHDASMPYCSSTCMEIAEGDDFDDPGINYERAQFLARERDSLKARLEEAERERNHWRDGIDRIGVVLGVPEHQDDIGVVDRAERVIADLTAARSRADALEGEVAAMRHWFEWTEAALGLWPQWRDSSIRERLQKALSSTAGIRAAEVIAAAREALAISESQGVTFGRLAFALAAYDGGESK